MKCYGSGWVVSRRFGSGRVRRFSNYHGSGRVTLSRPDPRGLSRPVNACVCILGLGPRDGPEWYRLALPFLMMLYSFLSRGSTAPDVYIVCRTWLWNIAWETPFTLPNWKG